MKGKLRQGLTPWEGEREGQRVGEGGGCLRLQFHLQDVGCSIGSHCLVVGWEPPAAEGSERRLEGGCKGQPQGPGLHCSHGSRSERCISKAAAPGDEPGREQSPGEGMEAAPSPGGWPGVEVQ